LVNIGYGALEGTSSVIEMFGRQLLNLFVVVMMILGTVGVLFVVVVNLSIPVPVIFQCSVGARNGIYLKGLKEGG